MVQPGESHTLTGVWIETNGRANHPNRTKRHTLTGVWIETRWRTPPRASGRVTPSRVCGLKLALVGIVLHGAEVTPSRVCGLKRVGGPDGLLKGRSHPHGCVD